MYLHHIVRRLEKELIRMFYEAQKLKESDGDWIKMLRKDLNELNIKKV